MSSTASPSEDRIPLNPCRTARVDPFRAANRAPWLLIPRRRVPLGPGAAARRRGLASDLGGGDV